jgi:5-methylcytosine-specific restriction endonuclease McrA
MKELTNEKLISSLKNLASEERILTAQILEYLREVERRRLYLEMGYSSLHVFCMKELQYSEGSTHRRIASMRLLRELPEIEEKIVSGELSLSVASQAQTFLKRQKNKGSEFNKLQKLELLEKLENTSARECEKVLLQLDPEPARQDRERQISESLVELRLTVDREFSEKIDRLKNIMSHTKPNLSTKEILEAAVDLLLAKKDLAAKHRNNDASTPSAPEVVQKVVQSNALPSRSLEIRANLQRPSRYIPAHIRREVWSKSNGQCCYKSAKTGRTCGSKRFLDIDHIQAHSRGGANTAENLQLLCSAHNRWKGVGA